MPRKPGYVTRQAERLSAGQINRRRFVASALSAGVTLPTALSLASRAEARVPKPGGHLRLAFASEDSFESALAFAHGNALTEITASGEVIGELAETFEPDTDATRWIATLRKGIRFHDGQVLTSNDVLATFARHRPPGVSAIRADGPQQVIFELDAPDPDFPRRLADPRFVILPADAPPNATPGTGPYRVHHIDPGATAELTRNPDYWKPGRAHVDTVRLAVTPDATFRHIALSTGEVDYADGIDPRSVALLRRDATILETPGTRHLAISRRDDPLKDALAHAIDGQTLVDRLLFGHGRAGATVYDPEKAARLVRTSGHSGPVPLAMPTDPTLREAARLIAETARIAGIEFTSQSDGWALDLRAGAPDPDTLVPVWVNDIAAHTKSLTHAEATASNLKNDGARLIERWWLT